MLRLRIILICLTTCFFASCQNDDFNIGKGWIDPNTTMIMVDTCTVTLSTTMVDSIITSGEKLALIGKYNDNYIGNITASSFMEIELPSSVEDIDNNAVFDSIVIRFTTNKKYYGDTLVQQKIFVHQVTETMELHSNKSLYNTSEIKYNAIPLASATFKSRPYHTSDTVVIKLDHAFGADLFQNFKDKSTVVSNNENFIRHLKGLALLPDTLSSSSILGYKITDVDFMTIHYHVTNDRKVEKEIKFRINTTRQFNKIKANRDGTTIAGLNKKNNEISSVKTNNQAFVATGAPLYAKINFPYIDNLLQVGEYGIIAQAKLIIRPVASTYGDPTPLPPTVNLVVLNELDNATSYITDGSNNTQTGSLFIDNIHFENTHYSFDITNYMNNYQLGLPLNQKRKLQLIIPYSAEANTIQRLVIGDMQNNRLKNRIELQLYYTSYNGEN